MNSAVKTKVTFTPGPWRLEESPIEMGNCLLRFQVWQDDATAPPSEPLTWNRVAFIESQNVGTQAALANARLIAAAPEMYDALLFVKEFFAKLEENTEANDPLRELRHRVHAPIHARLDAAIAKAEGRQ